MSNNLATILIGLLPSFAWLLFFLREDARHPEPKKMLTLAFFGGAVATLAAFFIELEVSAFLSGFGVHPYTPVSFLALAAVEEILKFAVVIWLIGRSRYFDEPIDAMIYLITAALGFAAVENIAALIGPLSDPSLVFGTAALRFIGATLLHSLAAGLVGYYWARGRAHHQVFTFAAEGLVFASIIHAVFNFLIYNQSTVVIPTLFLLLVGLLVLNDFEELKLFPAKKISHSPHT